MPQYRREPTNRELRERTITALKQTRLFERVSVRLLADLVDKYGLTTVLPAPDGLASKVPAVLVVLEGRIDLYMDGETPWPPPAHASPPPPGAPQPIPLSTGTYLRNLGPFRGLTSWQASLLRAAGTEPARIFLLEIGDFRDHLPRILVNALELGSLIVVAN